MKKITNGNSITYLVLLNTSLSSQACAVQYQKLISDTIIPRFVENDKLIIAKFDVVGVKVVKEFTSNLINGKSFKKDLSEALKLNDGFGTPVGSSLMYATDVAERVVTKKNALMFFLVGDGFDEKIKTNYKTNSKNISKEILEKFKKNVLTRANIVVSFLMLNPEIESFYKANFNSPNVLINTSTCSSKQLEEELKTSVDKAFDLLDSEVETKSKKEVK